MTTSTLYEMNNITPLNAELNPVRHLLALVGARHIVHVSRVRVKFITALSISVLNCPELIFLSC